ncbi:TorD/DmsD family molecular chaperone [Haladaptatus sp. NG-WS-4]
MTSTVVENGDANEAAAFARARARTYALLAAVFDGEMDVLASAMEEDVFARLAEQFPVEIDVEPLSAADFERETLAVGYDNLFVVPGSYYVPPFASAYDGSPSESFESDSRYHDVGTAGELLGDPAARIAHQYARAGFVPDRGDGIPDHLAAQFEFVSALATREAERYTDPLDADVTAADLRGLQQSVIENLGWLDAFDEAVTANDRVERVFAALARFARTFVAWDARQYDEPAVVE